jgi:hypothetical protein
MAWIKTSNHAPNSFNALKNNTLMVYPTGVFTYDGNQWNAANVKIYQNGEWNSFELVLYDGGMVAPFESYGRTSNSTYVYHYEEDFSTYLRGRTNNQNSGSDFYSGYSGWRTSDLYDLANYSTVTIKAEAWTEWDSYNGVKVALFDVNNNELAVFDVLKEVKDGYANSEWIFDISTYNTPAKIGITAWQSYGVGRGAEFKLYEMTLS